MLHSNFAVQVESSHRSVKNNFLTAAEMIFPNPVFMPCMQQAGIFFSFGQPFPSRYSCPRLQTSIKASRQIRAACQCTRVCKTVICETRCQLSMCGLFLKVASSSLLMQTWVTCYHKNSANKIHKQMVKILRYPLMDTWQKSFTSLQERKKL